MRSRLFSNESYETNSFASGIPIGVTQDDSFINLDRADQLDRLALQKYKSVSTVLPESLRSIRAVGADDEQSKEDDNYSEISY